MLPDPAPEASEAEGIEEEGIADAILRRSSRSPNPYLQPKETTPKARSKSKSTGRSSSTPRKLKQQKLPFEPPKAQLGRSLREAFDKPRSDPRDQPRDRPRGREAGRDRDRSPGADRSTDPPGAYRGAAYSARQSLTGAQLREIERQRREQEDRRRYEEDRRRRDEDDRRRLDRSERGSRSGYSSHSSARRRYEEERGRR